MRTFKSLKPSSERSRLKVATRARAGAPAPAPRAGAAAASRPATGVRRRGDRPRSPPAGAWPAAPRDVAHALVHDGTQLRELPERPVAMQHEAKRARVCQVQERQWIVPRLLQRVRKAAECAPGQLLLEAEQRQRRVACVEGRLAARAGESQSVARPPRGTRCHAGHARLVDVGCARPRRVCPRRLW